MKIKTKRRICLWTSMASCFATLGIVGGMERFWIPIGQGIALIIVGLVIAFGAAYKGGF